MTATEIVVDGIPIHYLTAGEGPALLMVHGLVGSAGNWAQNIPALAQHRTVYALDLPNMGQSGRSPNLPADLASTAQRLLRFLDAIGAAQADLVASSHGGAICLMLAALAPTRVRSLLLFAPANPFCTLGAPLIRLYNTRPGAWFARSLPYLPTFAHHLAHKRVYGDPSKARPEDLASYTAGLNAESINHVLRIVSAWWHDMALLREALPQIARTPTLLLWGTRDSVVGLPSGHQLAEALSAQLVLIPGAGHLPYAEDPDPCNAAMLVFLNRTQTLSS